MPFGPPAALAAIENLSLYGDCFQCGKGGATWRAEITMDHGPAYGFWCDATCHANWGTNQKPK